VVADLWVVGARLHAQVPTGELRIQIVAVEVGQFAEQSGPVRAQPEPVTEYLRTKPERHGEAGGAQPEHLAGVCRWLHLVVGLNRADRLALL
jgi:hypothetical protein